MRHLIKKIVNKIGYDIHKLNNNIYNYKLADYINERKINILYDVGANIGQFAEEMRNNNYLGEIISFEPLTKAHENLSFVAKNDDKWVVHERSAIGDFNGQIEINIAGNSVSSSLLPMLDSHSRAAPTSKYIGNENVSIITLDSVACDYIKKDSNLFIKIDTQGYEWQVLEGARQTLKNALGVHIELSLLPLYEGQSLWMEIIKKLNCEGFDIWNISKGFTDTQSGRMLQIDGTFFRK
jgi:FkbM family methyltransferase